MKFNIGDMVTTKETCYGAEKGALGLVVGHDAKFVYTVMLYPHKLRIYVFEHQIELHEATSTPETPWVAGRVNCIHCGYEWIAARPMGVVYLECPSCHERAVDLTALELS